MASGTSCAAFSQGGIWQKIEPIGAAPPARRDAAMVYDRDHNRLIVFGGQSGATVLNDTWAFDLATRSWRALATAGAIHPPARFSMVAGVDQVRQRMLITAGQASTGQFFNDIWSFDLTTDTWSEVAAQGNIPSARYGSAGGTANAGGALLYLSHGFTDHGRFDDTRVFDLATQTWSDLTPAGQVPLKRCLHAGAVVSSDTLVIFGGCASGFGPCPLGDTWRFDRLAGTWTALGAQGGPSARQFAAMAPAGDCPTALLFGGQRGGAPLSDLWRLDVMAGEWAAVHQHGTPPAARYGHAMVWVDSLGDAGNPGALLVFGGQGASADLNDLWALLPSSTTNLTPSLFLPLVTRR